MTRPLVLVLLLAAGTACEPPVSASRREETARAAACMTACGDTGSRYTQEHDWHGELVSATCTCMREAAP